MNPEKVQIGCKAPLFAPRCYEFNEYGCKKPMGECNYQYDFQEFWNNSSTSTKIEDENDES